MEPIDVISVTDEAAIEALRASCVGVPVKFGRDGPTVDRIASATIYTQSNGQRRIIAKTEKGMIVDVFRLPPASPVDAESSAELEQGNTRKSKFSSIPDEARQDAVRAIAIYNRVLCVVFLVFVGAIVFWMQRLLP